jgi:hypothetical protein
MAMKAIQLAEFLGTQQTGVLALTKANQVYALPSRSPIMTMARLFTSGSVTGRTA